MLDIINNFQNDQNLDVFNKICIYKASHFFGFDRFTGISELETILTTVSDAADILLLNLLPDNLQVKFNSVVRNNSLNVYYKYFFYSNTSISRNKRNFK